MPCYTPEPTEREKNSWGSLSERQLEAILCGIITKLGEGVIDSIDHQEVGVDRHTIRQWWKKHQEEDVKRKKREEEEVKRKESLSKLTTEEKKILGIAPF